MDQMFELDYKADCLADINLLVSTSPSHMLMLWLDTRGTCVIMALHQKKKKKFEKCTMIVFTSYNLHTFIEKLIDPTSKRNM